VRRGVVSRGEKPTAVVICGGNVSADRVKYVL
jgi:hypothetical protein